MSFQSHDVQWPVLNGEFTVHATLTTPTIIPNEVNAILLVAGGGPTNKDWCFNTLPFKNGSAKLLAELLAPQGYVTLRFNKLACSVSGPEMADKLALRLNMQAHVEELACAVNFLKSEYAGKLKKIIALANSEGCIHVVNYQLNDAQRKFDAMILTGMPGRKCGEVAYEQMATRMAKLPNVEECLAIYKEIVNDFLNGEPLNSEKADALPAPIGQMLGSFMYDPINSPLMRELFEYDPAGNLAIAVAKTKSPLLVIIGKLDAQVNWKADGKMIEEAVKGLDQSSREKVKFLYAENANHVLKHEEKGEFASMEEAQANYNAEGRKLDEEVFDGITQWLKEI